MAVAMIKFGENLLATKITSMLCFVFAAIFFTIGLFKMRRLSFGLSVALLFMYGYINIHINNIEMLWVILSLMGVGLLIIEALVPGVQLFGIVGIVLLVIGMIQSQESIFDGLLVLFISFLASIVTYFTMKKLGYRLESLDRLVLHDKNDSTKGFIAREIKDLVGKTGITTSVLRPTGYGEIDGVKYDLYAEDGFISEGEEVVVIGEKSMKILVRRNV